MIPSSSPSRRDPKARRGFTLSEVLVASSIFVVLATVALWALVLQSKVGMAIGNYADMNAYSRQALSQFEKDMRMATNIQTMASSEVIVSVIDSVDWSRMNIPANAVGGAHQIRYFYRDNKLYRQSPAGAVGSAPDAGCTVVLDNLKRCNFAYFNTDDNTATSNLSVKKILLSGTMQRNFTGIANTDYLVSAVVVMRSKSGTRL